MASTMRRNVLIIFICLGFLYISFKTGYEFGKKNAATPEILVHGFMATTAYTASLSLNAEVNNHQIIKSGNQAIAEQFSIDKMNILIKQIEGINYNDAQFKHEIDSNLSRAKNYLKHISTIQQ